MGRFFFVVTAIILVAQLFENYAVPLSALNSVDAISNSISMSEDTDEGPLTDDDDFTTHGLERLSSAATCLVAGIEYTHGQQIYRRDPCEFCLCLDGEMFCWWQDCPPTIEGPCRNRGPFTPCLNLPVSFSGASGSVALSSAALAAASSSSSSTTLTTPKATTVKQTTTTIPESSTDFTLSSEENSTEEIIQSTMLPTFCTVMGQKYQIGDKLPHDTGNCVECVCGQGAKITCSPHQCAPIGEDINDYRLPGSRQQVQDVF